MRIISGIFKGRKLNLPSDKKTRPLKDITKEAIFNIIKHSNKVSTKIDNSFVLDLFSGVGSFGIECISRGAKHVTFVENYHNVLPILKKNLIKIDLKNNYKIIEKNIIDDLNFGEFSKKFDIIFIDPPYKSKCLINILSNIEENKILSKNSLIIFHQHKKENDLVPENFKIIEKKNYGISKIVFGNF